MGDEHTFEAMDRAIEQFNAQVTVEQELARNGLTLDLMAICGVDRQTAYTTLDKCQWSLTKATRRLGKG